MERHNAARGEEGFSLVELLTVVIILGILAGITLPTMMNQREKSWRKAAMADLRNASTVMEQYFDDTGTYLAVGGLTPGVTPPYSFKASGSAQGDVEVSLPVAGVTSATRYCIGADHIKLNGSGSPDFHLDSDVGRPQPGGC